jgi:thiosulfate/3-mercaptopyruvate sulfurtransferase
MNRLAPIIIIALCAALSPAAANPQVDRDPGDLIVSVGWLADHFDDENLVLLHVGNRQRYDAAHIPGARYLEYSSISATSAEGLRLQMPPVEELRATFEELGVSDDSRIVLYFGTNWVTLTTRAFLTLEYLGLGPRTSILDGGMPAWEAAGHPVTDDVVPAPSRGSIAPRPQPAVIATADWVADGIGNERLAIIDARTSNFYRGTRGGHGMPRAGHIPGAGNIPFVTIVDDETNEFKDLERLREMFVAAGAEPGDQVVTYCHIGQQATLVWFAARLLGYEARMYDGSFQEWSNLPEVAVVRPAVEDLSRIISTDELAALIADENPVSIIDLRSDFNGYLEGHITGASYLHYENLRATNGGVPADVLPAESYATLFSRLGLSLERPVVIYSNAAGPNFNATFLAWVLNGFGHPEVYLLDGGYEKWLAENRPTTRAYPTVEETSFAADGFRPDRATRRLVEWSLDNDGMVIVDVRPEAQYAGRAGAQMRRGHIPGAVNHVWSSDLVAHGSTRVWKPVDELRAGYEAQGITPDKHVILYCNTGTEASHVYFALRNLLGYANVDVYFPSWTDWAAVESLPIEVVSN